MAKRPYFETAQRVLSEHRKHPTLNSVQLGEKLGLHPAYVRKVLQRNGCKLVTSKR